MTLKMNYLLVVVGLITLLLLTSANRKVCKYPPESINMEHADNYFMIGTRVLYECEVNYIKPVGIMGYFECRNTTSGVKWNQRTSEHFNCTSDNINQSSSDHLLYDVFEQHSQRDQCGPLPVIANAFLQKQSSNFNEGQEFNYTIGKNGLPGILKCTYCNEIITWIDKEKGCLSRSSEITPTAKISVSPFFLQPKEKSDESQVKRTERSPAAISVVGVILIAFLCWIILKKQRKKTCTTKNGSLKRQEMQKQTSDNKNVELDNIISY